MIVASLLLAAVFHVDFRETNVSFDPGTGAFTVEDVRAPGRVYVRGEIALPRGTASVPDIPKYRLDGERGIVTFDDAGKKSEIVLDASYDGVKIIAPKGCAITGEIVAGEPDDGTAVFALAKDARPSGLEAASGPAVPEGADAVFDRRSDALYTVDGAALLYSYENRRFRFRGEGEVRFGYRGGYLADKYRIAYRPVNTNATFRTPPVGWMTWYAVKFDACDRVVMENAKAFREKFRGYTDERPALWVDWEWFHEKMGSRGEEDHDMMSPRKTAYPRGMKAVADDLKGLGFTPALWVSMLCDVRTNAMWKAHPEWILATRDNWSGANWADPTAPGFCEKFVPEMFGLYRSWGYEAFKWDCLYNALWFFAKFRDRAHDPTLTSEEVFRRMLASGRKAVGPDTYLEGCAGLTDRVILGAIDILDSSRVGDDIFNWASFLNVGVNRILNYYPFHQTVFYADADNLVLRSEFSNEAQARTRVSVYGLSGVAITVGDRMSALDGRRVDMLRRVMPVVPTHPATLGRDICRGTDLDLKVDIRRPYGSWQVRGWSNFATNAVRHVKFAPEGAAVWDFWNDRLMTETEFDVAPCDTRVVRVTPLAGMGPTLLSVSRHITQGGYELLRYSSDHFGARGVVRCPGGEMVKVTFLLPEGVKVASASHPYDLDGRVLRLKLAPAERADVAFAIALETGAKGAEKVLEDSARVVFFGDSITHHGWWSLAIANWCFTKHPDRKYTFVNAGIGGDSTARAVVRVAEDVAPANPTVVVTMLGMNDTWLTPEAYGANLERLRAELRARCPKAQLVWFTPSPYDPTVPEKPVAGKAVRLVEFVAVVRAFAARTGDACIDMNGPMTAYNLLRQRTDPKFSLCGKDGVHPRIDGGRHMGRLFLRAIGEDATMEELGRLNDSPIGQLNRKIRDKLDMRQCYGMLRHFLLRKYLGERMDDLEAVKGFRAKYAEDPKVTKDYCWRFIDAYIRDWPAREKLTAEADALYAQIEQQRGGLRK